MEAANTYDGLTVANDWSLYAVPNIGDEIRRIPLSDPSTSTVVVAAHAAWSPSLGDTGPVQPAPPAYGGPISPPTTTPPSPIPSPTATTPAPTLPPVVCPKLKVFGVRGSRGSLGDTSTSDSTLDAFVRTLSTHVAGTSFEPIAYPAIPVGYGGVKVYGNELPRQHVRGYVQAEPTAP